MSCIQIIWAVFGGISLLLLSITISVCMLISSKIQIEHTKLRIKKMKLETKLLEERVKEYE